MSQAMTNIVARMYVRNLHPSVIEKRGRFNLRPRAQTFAATRDLGGRCWVGHMRFWDHVAVHLPHDKNLGHSQSRCFVIMHMFPGEAGLRTMLDAWRGKLRRRRI